jgi:hypothetical protein
VNEQSGRVIRERERMKERGRERNVWEGAEREKREVVREEKREIKMKTKRGGEGNRCKRKKWEGWKER